MSYCPIYWPVKIAFLFYLSHSDASGAKVVWETILLPACRFSRLFKEGSDSEFEVVPAESSEDMEHGGKEVRGMYICIRRSGQVSPISWWLLRYICM